jgi:dipeptidyl aminopeptidase/acylaminoacyl peptidase
MTARRVRRLLTGLIAGALVAGCVRAPAGVGPDPGTSTPAASGPTPVVVVERRETPPPTPVPTGTPAIPTGTPTGTPVPTATPSPFPTPAPLLPPLAPTEATWVAGEPTIVAPAISGSGYLTRTFGLYIAESFADPILLTERGSQPALNRSPDGRMAAIVWGGNGRDAAGIQVLSTERPEPFRLVVRGDAMFFTSWSPEGREFAFTLLDRGGNTVWLHAPATGQFRRLEGLGPHVSHIAWAPDGTGLYVGVGSGAYLVPRAGGEARPLLRTTADGLAGVELGISGVSPDGRFEAIPDVEPYRTPTPTPVVTGTRTPQVPRAPFGLILRDRRTGAERVLTTPDRGYDHMVHWAPDSRHLVVFRADSWGGDRATYMLVLVDTVTGRETPLTDGFERNVRARFSPSGERVLVTGSRLRVYARDGSLLWWVQPPAGMDVRDAIWGTGDQRILYATGPAGFSCCL